MRLDQKHFNLLYPLTTHTPPNLTNMLTTLITGSTNIYDFY